MVRSRAPFLVRSIVLYLLLIVGVQDCPAPMVGHYQGIEHLIDSAEIIALVKLVPKPYPSFEEMYPNLASYDPATRAARQEARKKWMSEKMRLGTDFGIHKPTSVQVLQCLRGNLRPDEVTTVSLRFLKGTANDLQSSATIFGRTRPDTGCYLVFLDKWEWNRYYTSVNTLGGVMNINCDARADESPDVAIKSKIESLGVLRQLDPGVPITTTW